MSAWASTLKLGLQVRRNSGAPVLEIAGGSQDSRYLAETALISIKRHQYLQLLTVL